LQAGYTSRLHAVRDKQTFDKYIVEKGHTGIKTLAAFSRTLVGLPDRDYCETVTAFVEAKEGGNA
jgi:hypothetical protein